MFKPQGIFQDITPANGFNSTNYNDSQVILLMFTENADMQLRTEMFELFAGQGAVTRVFKRNGAAAVRYDQNMTPGGRTMDFLGEAGFASHPHF